MLERVIAVPYAIADGQLHVAIADRPTSTASTICGAPASLTIAVASRYDIQSEIRASRVPPRLSRARAVLDEEPPPHEAEEDEPTTSSGRRISDAPLAGSSTP